MMEGEILVKGGGLPVKLAVGGLHGREWIVSRRIESKIRSVDWGIVGSFIFVPRVSFDTYYRTTLDISFYRSEAGLNLIRLIKRFKPSIYIEIHGYAKSSLRRLIDPMRLQKKGVPSFFKLKSGLLLGSISPITLSLVDIELPLALELPLKHRRNALIDCMKLLRLVAESRSVEDTWRILVGYYNDPMFRSYMERMRIWINLFRR